jgi:hypothetical protein
LSLFLPPSSQVPPIPSLILLSISLTPSLALIAFEYPIFRAMILASPFYDDVAQFPQLCY